MRQVLQIAVAFHGVSAASSCLPPLSPFFAWRFFTFEADDMAALGVVCSTQLNLLLQIQLPGKINGIGIEGGFFSIARESASKGSSDFLPPQWHNLNPLFSSLHPDSRSSSAVLRIKAPRETLHFRKLGAQLSLRPLLLHLELDSLLRPYGDLEATLCCINWQKTIELASEGQVLLALQT